MDIGSHQGFWPISFSVTICGLWQDRNTLVFSNTSTIGSNFSFKMTNQFIVLQGLWLVESSLVGTLWC